MTFASSFTCHKAQGITNTVGAVVDLDEREDSAGTTYVAQSRAGTAAALDCREADNFPFDYTS